MREVGSPRIVFAALIGGLTRAFGRGGDFYWIAGRRVAAIDGPNRYTVNRSATTSSWPQNDRTGLRRT